MRVLSWNINGVKTLPHYHPWNACKTFQDILDTLEADIICFQEMKTSKPALQRPTAIPDGYDGFFSFPVTKAGYSGVAVYAKTASAPPLKAEEGISGYMQPKPPLSDGERVSMVYPQEADVGFYPDVESNTSATFASIDSEGRGLVIDFGLFVLINVYCPNETSDARLPFKMNYSLLLQERVRQLVEIEHRQVIVCGDINVCATPMDHCEGFVGNNAAEFWLPTARKWFHKWLSPVGPMIDAVRTFWPHRKDMYTCWNQKIMARDTNYGTRVDYILVTPGLLPWIKHGDIQPSLKGSDHCPIFIDLHDEIVLPTGEKMSIHNALRPYGGRASSPRICARAWPEFSTRQKLLSNFFGKKSQETTTNLVDDPEPTTFPKTPIVDELVHDVEASEVLAPVASSTECPVTSERAGSPPLTEIPSSQAELPTPSQDSLVSNNDAISVTTASSATRKRKQSSPSSPKAVPPAKKDKKSAGQRTLGSFFSKRPSATPPETIDVDSVHTTPHASSDDVDLSYIDSDFELAKRLAAEEPEFRPSSSTANCDPAAWNHLTGPVKPPNCTIHGEPAREYTVKKPGLNKGKTFFLCSRPVGPGYDAGRSHRARQEVDHRYRCDFFKWTSDVKRDAARLEKMKSR